MSRRIFPARSSAWPWRPALTATPPSPPPCTASPTNTTSRPDAAFEALEAGLRDRDHAQLRATLGDAAFEAAYARGRTLSQADAIALAVGTAEPDPGVASAVTVPAAGQATADSSAGLLSEREREIVALLAGGATDAQIAGRLFLSVNTVRSHLERIRDKTGARRRAELVRYAIQAGIEAVTPSA